MEEFEIRIARQVSNCQMDNIRADLERLGIEASVVGSAYSYRVIFDTIEDMNLYKLLGKINKPYSDNNLINYFYTTE